MRKKAWVHQKGSRWVAKLVISAALTAIICGTGSAFAQTFNSGSTGADGAFNPTTNTTLALPPDGVFNFTTINIPAGVTVTFTRNAANTPVTILASGNATIAGTIAVSGSPGGTGVSSGTILASNAGAGGPGGFDGGDGADGIVSTTGGAGLGPGGGAGGLAPSTVGGGGGGGFVVAGGNGGAFSTFGPATTPGGGAYGTLTLLPLIGGSGGGGGGAVFGNTGGGAGGGGGALLIASSGTITFTGTLLAKGGQGGGPSANIGGTGQGGGGSGGAIRLVATAITGSGGTINVSGGPGVANTLAFSGTGSAGRIRVEVYSNTATINFAQVPSIDQPGALALPGTPSLTITSVAGVVAPASPTGSFATPDITLPAGTANPMSIALAASNIPLGTTVTVTAKPLDGAASSATSTPLAGTLAASTATASLTIPTNQPSVISASATFTLAAIPGTGPLFAQGEAIEQVHVAAVLGGPSRVVYITRSGREIAP